MQKLIVPRRVELIGVLSIVAILLSLGLYVETLHYNSLLVMDQNGLYNTLEGYNRLLHTFFPAIARAVLLLIAWYIFHYQAYPLVKAGKSVEKAVAYAGLILIFIATGVGLHHYFKLYLSFSITNNIVTSIRPYSLYRKLTVFSDTVGILIIFGLYELFAQVYYYLHSQFIREKENFLRFLSYFLLACLAVFVFIAAVITPFPTTLWKGFLSEFLFISGLVILVLILQEYVFRYLLPLVQTPRSALFIKKSITYLLIGFAGIYILWGCYNQFEGFTSKPTGLFFILLLASWFHAYVRSMFSREKKILQTQVSATSAELSGLRSQINPHFLFNALNSLYATALKEKSEKTADGIQKLGDMMRFMLQENHQDRIPLDKEVEYLHNYIAIQRMRIDESQGVEIRVNIQEPDREIYIAPMMLNPFVENAFKHGVSLQYPSWIYITLTLDATRLYFKVHNSLQAQREYDPEEGCSGVGLANVKKRLELIYPNRHTLDIQQSDKDYFVSLTLAYW